MTQEGSYPQNLWLRLQRHSVLSHDQEATKYVLFQVREEPMTVIWLTPVALHLLPEPQNMIRLEVEPLQRSSKQLSQTSSNSNYLFDDRQKSVFNTVGMAVISGARIYRLNVESIAQFDSDRLLFMNALVGAGRTFLTFIVRRLLGSKAVQVINVPFSAVDVQLLHDCRTAPSVNQIRIAVPQVNTRKILFDASFIDDSGKQMWLFRTK